MIISEVAATRLERAVAPVRDAVTKAKGRWVSLVATSDGERVAVTAFLTYTVLAGGNAAGIRFSNRELAPLWGASLRFALACALFVAVMVVLRLVFPRGRALVGRCCTACSTSPARSG